MEKILGNWLNDVPEERKIYVDKFRFDNLSKGKAKADVVNFDINTKDGPALKKIYNLATGRSIKEKISYVFKYITPIGRGDIDDEEVVDRNGKFFLKRNDINIFNPYYYDPNNLGTVIDGKNIIFTNVFNFIARIKTYTDDLSKP